MNRTEKAENVAELSARVQGVPLLLFADYRGISVSRISALRKALKDNGAEYRVVKNTLLRRAVAGTPKEGVGSLLSGMTGVVMSGDDPIATAKALREMIKDLQKEEKFVIKGAWFDGDVIQGPDALKVADLPSREELLSVLLRTIQEGPRQVLGVIQGPARDLLYLLKNYERKLEEAAGQAS